MVESTQPDDKRYSEWKARRRFHFALAGVFLAWLLPFVSWWLALRQWHEGPVRWRRLLLGLAVVDTLVFACFVVFTLHTSAGARGPSRAPRDIGVFLAPAHPPGRVVITSVVPQSPAAKAGLRAGDGVTRLDGKPVRTNADFARSIHASGAGQKRRLHVQRGSAQLDVTVVPRVGVRFPAGRAPPLFAPVPESRSLSWSAGTVLHQISGELATLFVLLLVGVIAWRRRARLGPVAWVAVGIAVPVLVGLAVITAFAGIVGLSLGAVLLSMLAATLTMLGVGALAMRRLDKRVLAAVEPDEPLGTARAFGLGVFYTFAGAARAGIVLGALVPLMHLPDHPASQVFPVSLDWGAGGVLLFALGTVVAAPLAEECLFRGVLVPWMASWMKPELAIVGSALAFGIGHLFYGAGLLVPFVYGVVLAWVRLSTGKLRAGIALHMLINVVATLAVLLSR